MVTPVGYSDRWSKTGAKRLAQTSGDDLSVRPAPSRARNPPFPGWDPLGLARIEPIRVVPSEGLPRTPGPKALRSDLPRDAAVRERGCRLPQSTSPIWKRLTRLGLLADPPSGMHQPEPQRAP